jgi:hypothetical protein
MIGQRLPTLMREDAFRIESHRENSVSSLYNVTPSNKLIAIVGDKAKEAKERQEREARDKAHAGNAYNIPDPSEMGADDELSGLPWGSLSLKYVVSRGMARESESWRGSPKEEDRSYDGSQGRASDDRDGHYEEDSQYYGEADQAYYDYGSGSGSGHGGSSR